MTNVLVGGIITYPYLPIWNSTSAGASIASGTSFSTSGYAIAFVFKVPKTGSLSRIPFFVNSNSVGGIVNCSFQTVSASAPTGTLYGGSASQAVTLSGQGSYEAVLSTPASATAGDVIAAVITCDGTSTPTFALGTIGNASSAYTHTQFPFITEYTGSWAASNNTRVTCIGIGYSSTDYIFFSEACPVSAFNTTSVSTTATVRAWGAVFTPPIPMVIEGVRYIGSASPIRTGSFQIRDSSGSSTLATATITLGAGTSFNGGVDVLFDSGAINLSAGTQYRVAYFPATSTSTVMPDATLPNAGCMAAMSGGPNWWLTTMNSSNVWDDSNTTHYPFTLALRVSKLSDGSGGGGSSGIIVPSRFDGGVSQ